ncbi:hypothetical protein ARMSODRAFT_965515 [Armillaria solidipes]|uniref:Uncharacterized protein n=1 Tax=Armillaria solidipes TaxID=1076256 RepID=A0A2H3B4D9_9AGAR|nr:hypothetical protein ARMSODRAFT_965515 [Armillaria solidipes]
MPTITREKRNPPPFVHFFMHVPDFPPSYNSTPVSQNTIAMTIFAGDAAEDRDCHHENLDSECKAVEISGTKARPLDYKLLFEAFA